MAHPIRNPRYLTWVRSLPCCVCKTDRNVEAAHTGMHGMSQKSSDTTAIPLCTNHHTAGNDSYHKLGQRRFEARHNLCIREIVQSLNARPIIRLRDGNYIGQVENVEYVLGPLHIGLPRAVRQMKAMRREMLWEALCQ